MVTRYSAERSAVISKVNIFSSALLIIVILILFDGLINLKKIHLSQIDNQFDENVFFILILLSLNKIKI